MTGIEFDATWYFAGLSNGLLLAWVIKLVVDYYAGR